MLIFGSFWLGVLSRKILAHEMVFQVLIKLLQHFDLTLRSTIFIRIRIGVTNRVDYGWELRLNS